MYYKGNFMKKIVSILIIFCLVISLCVGCTGSTDGTAPATVTPSQENTDKEPTSKPGVEQAASDTDKQDSQKQDSQKQDSQKQDTDKQASDKSDSDVKEETPVSNNNTETDSSIELSLYFNSDGSWAFGSVNRLYDKDVALEIFAPAGADVYYTTDGSAPTAESDKYTEAIVFKAHGGSFPHAYSFRAVAVFEDGSTSNVAARNILASTKMDGRYSTLVFCVSGEPDELTNKPDGIFTGKNYEQRGRESERLIYLDVFRPDGSNVISQYSGVRIYGGYSRQSTMKSMKLFARKSYDEDHKNFKLNDFGTLKLDGSGDIINKYDKLVLRNSGNDFQFAFIRDELSQTLVKKAGFECYEGVLPAVCYLNGEYYGFFWLHENYCDKYFKEKFGDAEGEFYVLEGGDQKKSDEDDPETQKLVDDYNTHYNRFIAMDLTSDSNYKQVCDYIDVQSYLDFFAWNIALNNWDWPNNNYKLFRYVEAPASVLADKDAVATPDNPVFDGRWRFLPHDMDYTYGLYGQNTTQASYNTLKVVLSKNNERYAPLFAKLMERSDCRSYFRAKTMEFLEGPLSAESIISTYNELHAERYSELEYFYKYIEQQNRKGDTAMWTSPENYYGTEDDIIEFAKKRASYVIKYMDRLLPAIE